MYEKKTYTQRTRILLHFVLANFHQEKFPWDDGVTWMSLLTIKWGCDNGSIFTASCQANTNNHKQEQMLPIMIDLLTKR